MGSSEEQGREHNYSNDSAVKEELEQNIGRERRESEIMDEIGMGLWQKRKEREGDPISFETLSYLST